MNKTFKKISILLVFTFLLKNYFSYDIDILANESPYLFDKETGTILAYDTKIGGRNVVIPAYIDNEKVTSIADYAFKECDLLSVIIPDTLQKIGKEAFANNFFIVSFDTKNVSFIDELAFNNCYLGNQLTIGSKLTHIGKRAFENAGISNLYIPDTVVSVDNSAFELNLIENIYINNGKIVNVDDWTWHPDVVKTVFHVNYIINNNSVSTKRYSYNEKVDKLNSQKEGYEVVWYYDPLCIFEYDFNDSIKKDTSIYGVEKKKVYNVKFIDCFGKQIGKIQKVEYGDDAEAPVLENLGNYEFIKWNKNLKNVKEDMVIQGIFEKRKVKITIEYHDGEEQINNENYIKVIKDK